MSHSTHEKVGHTPGPWGKACNPVTGAFRIVAGEGQIITERSAWPTNELQCEANARLITAAPEMLAALIEARADIISFVTARGSEYEGSADDAVAYIDAAIRAAKGQDQ